MTMNKLFNNEFSKKILFSSKELTPFECQKKYQKIYEKKSLQKNL